MTVEGLRAVAIVKGVAEMYLRIQYSEVLFTLGLRDALSEAFHRPELIPTSESDLARSALDVLIQDPLLAEAVGSVGETPKTPYRRYSHASTIALTTAVLFVLQTRIKFKIDNSGKWSFEMDKRVAGDGTVKLLVQRLLSFLGG